MSLKGKMAQRAQEGLPWVTHQLRIHDDKTARADLAAAVQSGDPERIAAARSALEGCFEPLVVQSLEPDVMEKLIGRHKPTEEQEKRTGAVYNTDTFPQALVFACVQDSDITEDDWAEYLNKGPLSPGEANALFNACWDVNYRAPDPWLPKGWTGTRS